MTTQCNLKMKDNSKSQVQQSSKQLKTKRTQKPAKYILFELTFVPFHYRDRLKCRFLEGKFILFYEELWQVLINGRVFYLQLGRELQGKTSGLCVSSNHFSIMFTSFLPNLTKVISFAANILNHYLKNISVISVTF
mgnify:CR=1 FL=1